MKNVLITICGRAGSKGFKNKNLKVFLNKPLVYYTLRSAFDFKARVKDADVDIALNTDSRLLQNLVLEKYPETEKWIARRNLPGILCLKWRCSNTL